MPRRQPGRVFRQLQQSTEDLPAKVEGTVRYIREQSGVWSLDRDAALTESTDCALGTTAAPDHSSSPPPLSERAGGGAAPPAASIHTSSSMQQRSRVRSLAGRSSGSGRHLLQTCRPRPPFNIIRATRGSMLPKRRLQVNKFKK